MKRRHVIFFIIALGVFILDQVTKYYIKNRLGLHEPIAVLPFFNLVYVENTGSAFGLFKSLGNAFFIFFASAAMVIISVMIIKEQESGPGLSLILGGAAGNLADRVFHGYVIDFLDIYIGSYHWPAFNIADSALTVGIGLVIISSFLSVIKPDS